MVFLDSPGKRRVPFARNKPPYDLQIDEPQAIGRCGRKEDAHEMTFARGFGRLAAQPRPYWKPFDCRPSGQCASKTVPACECGFRGGPLSAFN